MKSIVVYGFLGSGKTTFIEQFMQVHPAGKIVILENEAGDHAIDSEVLRQKDYRVIDIRSGCVCCTLRGELRDKFLYIRDELSPDYLVLEPSGLAGLEDLISIPDFHADTIISLLDVTRWPLLKRINESFYKRQYLLSPVIVLTKTDLVPESVTCSIREELAELNRGAFIFDSTASFFSHPWNAIAEHCSRFQNFVVSSGHDAVPEFRTSTFHLEDAGADSLADFREFISSHEDCFLRYKDNLQQINSFYKGDIFLCWTDEALQARYLRQLEEILHVPSHETLHHHKH